MCSRPITHNGKTFACRSCDECIATRRHGWVARAMAEKTDHAHTLCVALTYSDATPEGRDGARMFQYSDVRAFLKRLRQAMVRHIEANSLNVEPTVRFLCAGEQGDRNGRCHWHMIIYSSVDLTRLGIVEGFPKHSVGPRKKAVLTERGDMLTLGKDERRLNWSLWPLGFVTFQEPDEGGMKYVLSYCLKDQFIGAKAKDTMREAKQENFATGLFRMSKRPAIGENWLLRKMEELDAKGAVLPALQLRIPDFGGYWVPSGLFREKLLWGLVAINKRHFWSTGRNAPQWAALLASCSENETDLEILNGNAKKKADPDYQDPEARAEFDSRWKRDEQQATAVAWHRKAEALAFEQFEERWRSEVEAANRQAEHER